MTPKNIHTISMSSPTTDHSPPPLVLASTSFRRQELLRWTGLKFEIAQPDFDEDQLHPSDFPSTAALVEALSFGKAMSLVEKFPEAIILAGDTLIELDGEIIGKPKNLDHAREILSRLSGNSHQVFTGITVVDTSTMNVKTVSVKSIVWFKKLTDAQLESYVQSGEPLGKAGAYGIQSGAREFVDHIETSWTNVIGLPLPKVCEMLGEFSVSVAVNIHKVIEEYLGVRE